MAVFSNTKIKAVTSSDLAQFEDSGDYERPDLYIVDQTIEPVGSATKVTVNAFLIKIGARESVVLPEVDFANKLLKFRYVQHEDVVVIFGNSYEVQRDRFGRPDDCPDYEWYLQCN